MSEWPRRSGGAAAAFPSVHHNINWRLFRSSLSSFPSFEGNIPPPQSDTLSPSSAPFVLLLDHSAYVNYGVTVHKFTVKSLARGDILYVESFPFPRSSRSWKSWVRGTTIERFFSSSSLRLQYNPSNHLTIADTVRGVMMRM